MGAIKNRKLLQEEATLNNDFSEVKKMQIKSSWEKAYDAKKYDKLNSNAINELLKAKLVIGQSFFWCFEKRQSFTRNHISFTSF